MLSDTVRNLAGTKIEELVLRLATVVGVPYSKTETGGQLGAWRRSLPELFGLLIGSGLGHLQIALEYRLPYSPRRVDAVLCGVHPETGRPSYVLVELKQWSNPKMVEYGLVDPFAGRGNARLSRRPELHLHPSEQVSRYCRYLLDFTPQLARTPGAVKGIAWLHNARRSADWTLDGFQSDEFGELYTDGQGLQLKKRLTALLDPSDATGEAAREAARHLTESRNAPTRTLLKTAADALAGRRSFRLLDEQQVAYDLVLRAVERADQPDGQWRKTAIVVHGGPGSGKSAIAVSLMAALAGRWGKVLHATGSRAFTETLRRDVAGGDVRVEGLFKYFNEFGGVETDSLDVLVCDEAHRIRDVPAGKDHLSQVGKLIDVAKVPVFLLDEHQAVRPGETQTVRRIVEIARGKGCEVEEIELKGQFRCGGSELFDEWVLRLLGIVDGGPLRWSDYVADTDDEYVVDAVGSPGELETWLERQSKNFGGSARIAAGFCWDWHDPVREDGEYQPVVDVQIGDWGRPWNIKQGHEAEGYPSASYWASDPDGWGQLGCIYTAQGFEYDWAGVILGEDLLIRDGRWVSQREKSCDGSVRNATPENFDRLIRNTYKVLMTRGMQGTCLFSVDPETNTFLRKYCG